MSLRKLYLKSEIIPVLCKSNIPSAVKVKTISNICTSCKISYLSGKYSYIILKIQSESTNNIYNFGN